MLANQPFPAGNHCRDVIVVSKKDQVALIFGITKYGAQCHTGLRSNRTDGRLLIV